MAVATQEKKAESSKFRFRHIEGIGKKREQEILRHLKAQTEQEIKTQKQAEDYLKETVKSEKSMFRDQTHKILRQHFHGNAEEAKVAEETIETEEAQEKAAKTMTAREELEERIARKKLEEMEREEKLRVEEEKRKKSLWGRTKAAWAKGKSLYGKVENVANVAATAPQNFLLLILIIIGGFSHFWKYSLNFTGYIIDASLAVYMGVVIFLQSKQTNPVKRILYSLPWPVGLLLFSQGLLFVFIDWFPFLAAIPGLRFTFDPRYWPVWALYGVWKSDAKIAQILKIAHAMFVFWLMMWPIMSPVLQPILEQAQISRERVEARGASYPAAYAACVGEMTQGLLTNVDLQTCVQRKMYPPTEEEIKAATIGRIKKALRQAVTASVTINPNQLFFLPETQPTIRGRVSATSIKKPIEITLNCLINNKTATIDPATFSVRQSEIGDSIQFGCKPLESLTRGIHEITVTGDIPKLEVNSVVVNFFIEEDALIDEQERLITSKDPANLKIIEEWSSLKAKTTPYSLERATNYLNKEIYKSYISATYPNLKVESESDPGYVLLNLMIDRIYPEARESSAVVGLSQNKAINFEIGIVNNLKFGKIISITRGKFEEWPSFLEVAQNQDRKKCPIIPGTHELDENALKQISWKTIKEDKEHSFVCELEYTGQLENPESITTSTFSLTLDYDYQIEKKGTFEIKLSPT